MIEEYKSKYTGQEIDRRLEQVEINNNNITDAVSQLTELLTENAQLRERIAEQDILIENLQNTKIEKEADDYYPQLSVGIADNLAGVDVVENAFMIRQSGGGAITDGVARVQSIKGNSVVWNQLLGLYAYGFLQLEDDGVTYGIAEGVDEITWTSIGYPRPTAIVGHKYFVCYNALSDNITASHNYILINGNYRVNPNAYNLLTFDESSVMQTSIRLTPESVGARLRLAIYDLTLMFGTGNEPTTIEEFYQRIPSGVSLHAYNEGEVIGVRPDGIKSVGVNAWDEEWENGRFSNMGVEESYSGKIRSKNYIPVLANVDYYYTSPISLNFTLYDKEYRCVGSWQGHNVQDWDIEHPIGGGQITFTVGTIRKFPRNVSFIKFSTWGNNITTYNHDICINLSNADINGQYFPYTEASEDLSFVSKYFPQGLRSAGTAHDEIRYNKTTNKWEAVQRIGVVDLGTLKWSASNQENYIGSFYAQNGILDKTIGNNLCCTKYITTTKDGWPSVTDVDKSINSSYQDAYITGLWIRDAAYTDAASFKADMQGVMLYYELAEPIVTEIVEPYNLDYSVWNCGTEQMVAEGASLPLSAEITYGYNVIGKIKELESKQEVSKECVNERIEDIEVLIEDLQNTKIEKEADDYYPQLSVGVADNLAGVDMVSSAFTIRRSGGGAITDGVARVQSIKGNSVVWNQLVDITKCVSNSGQDIITLLGNGFLRCEVAQGTNYGGISINPKWTNPTIGHKYAVVIDLSTNAGLNLNVFGNSVKNIVANTNLICTASSTTFTLLVPTATINEQSVSFETKICITDLTLMFGAGNEPTTIEEFYQHIPSGVSLHAYNEGEVISVRPDGIKSVGVNQWDEEWELGGVDGASGQKYDSTTRIRTRNYIPIVSGATYHIHIGSLANNATAGSMCWYDEGYKFIEYVPIDAHKEYTAPASARYCLIGFYASYGTTYNHDICINISDAEKNGTYESYIKRIQTLDIIGKYFPEGMRSVGTAHDEIRYNKASQRWEKVQRIGEVDMGSLSWEYQMESTGAFFRATIADKRETKVYGESSRLLCSKYTAVATNYYSSTKQDKAICESPTAADVIDIYVADSAYTDVASFKADLQGVMLYYELAESIVTEIAEPYNLDYSVWNCGTEQMVVEGTSLPLLAEITYGYNAIGKIKELENKQEYLYNNTIQKGADDYYPQLSVGVADNLAGVDVVSSAFMIRQSGGGAITDGVARVQSIKGNSVVWNQLFDMNTADRSYNENGVHITDNRDGSYAISTDDGGATLRVSRSISVTHNLNIVGHKLLITGCDGAKDGFGFWDSFSNTIGTIFKNNTIVTASSNGQTSFTIIINEGVIVSQTTWKPRVFDLTLMFGAGNEPTTIEEFYARCPIGVDWTMYDEGTIVNMSADGIKSVGINQWDEEWENGSFDTTTGKPYDTQTQIRPKGYIRILPNTQYYASKPASKALYFFYYDADKRFLSSYSLPTSGIGGSFTTPKDAYYMRFFHVSSTYNHDICINLSNADINGQYFPYTEASEDLSFVSKYFPQGLRSAGTAHDEIRYNKQSKKWEAVQRIGEIDFSGASAYTSVENTFLLPIADMKVATTNPERGTGLLCAKYPMHGGVDGYNVAGMSDKSMLRMGNGYIYVKDSAFGADVTAFKTAMADVMLYYELAEPIVTEIAEPYNLDYSVWNFGTEQLVATESSSALSADITYGFNAVGLIKQIKAALQAAGLM